MVRTTDPTQLAGTRAPGPWPNPSPTTISPGWNSGWPRFWKPGRIPTQTSYCSCRLMSGTSKNRSSREFVSITRPSNWSAERQGDRPLKDRDGSDEAVDLEDINGFIGRQCQQ